MRMTQNWVLLKKVKVKNHTAGGIIIPELVGEDKRHLAEVIEVGPGNVGPGAELIPCCVKKGEIVYIAGALELPVGRTKYHRVRDHEIFAVWEGDPETDLIREEEPSAKGDSKLIT